MADPPLTPPTNQGQDNTANKPDRSRLTEAERKQLISDLLAEAQWPENGRPKLPRGFFKFLSERYGVDRKTIFRIWKLAQANRNDPNIGAFRVTPKKKSGGGGRLYCTDDIKMKVAAMPLCQKLSIRKLSVSLDMPKSTLHDYIKRGYEEDEPIIRPHSSAIKPALKDYHKAARFNFAISRLDTTTGLFEDCLQEVHVDEKWFYLTRDRLHCWLSVDEPDPHRITRHKSHVPKVMSLAAAVVAVAMSLTLCADHVSCCCGSS